MWDGNGDVEHSKSGAMLNWNSSTLGGLAIA